MLTSRYKAVFNRMLDPLARRIARTGVSPSTLTLATPALTSALCLWLVRSRAILPFCLAMLLVGLLDGLDGAVARAGGRVSRFGAYLDALCDRYVEALVVLAVAAVTGYWALSMVVLAGAQLVSYAKARAAMEAPVSNLEWPDLMERTERSLLFLAGLAASQWLPWVILGKDLFWWTLAVLAVLIHLTVLQRVQRARRLILERAQP
jgi:phosphatidylglycerophosphate synthase